MVSRQVFISYAHRPPDDSYVLVVRDALEILGLDVWSDHRLRAAGGSALNAEIAEAVTKSVCLLALVSGQSLASGYCQAEIAFALEVSVPVIRVDLESLAQIAKERFGSVLPILAPPISSDAIEMFAAGTMLTAALRNALAHRGIATSTATQQGRRNEFADLAGDPHARIIRPRYRDLKASDEASLRAFRERLIHAGALAPENGFNALSLAFLHLELGAIPQAQEAASRALANLPDEPDAHYAVALVACAASDPARRNLEATKAILRLLAAARRRPGYGAHVDALTARAVANFYLPRAIHPPAPISEIIAMARGRPRDDEEIERAARYEPIGRDRLPEAVVALIEEL